MTSTKIIHYTSLLQRLRAYYAVLQNAIKPENWIMTTIYVAGVGYMALLLRTAINYCKWRLLRLLTVTNTIEQHTNRVGYEQMDDLLYSLCRDDSKLMTIQGDDGMEDMEDDVLTHDEENTLIPRSGMPPVSIRFIPGVFNASFFYVNEKNPAPSQKIWWWRNIVYIARHDDPTLVAQLIPSSISNKIAWVWDKFKIRETLVKVLGYEFYNSIFGGSFGNESKSSDSSNNNKSDTKRKKIFIYTWSASSGRDMKHLYGWFQKEAAHFHKQRMTKSLIIHDLTNDLQVVGSPRPMSTIAIDEDSDINQLKMDVKSFFNDITVYENLTANFRPHQQINILHGPPGNGKSSILQALAIEYGIKYYIMNIGSNKNLDLTSIHQKLIPTLGDNCLVVFEDAESALPKEDDDDGGGGGGAATQSLDGGTNETKSKSVAPKFSVDEFLELFDGSVKSGKPHGRLVFFTTNTPNALHHKVATMANHQYSFLNPGKATMEDYWSNFFQDQSKRTIVQSWNKFSKNYDLVWNNGNEEDHTTYRIYDNVAAGLLTVNEKLSSEKKSIRFGLNGQNDFVSNHVYCLRLKSTLKCFIGSSKDWRPGFFWKCWIEFYDAMDDGKEEVEEEEEETEETEEKEEKETVQKDTKKQKQRIEFIVYKSAGYEDDCIYLTLYEEKKLNNEAEKKYFTTTKIKKIQICEHRQHSMACLQKYLIGYRGDPNAASLQQNVEYLGASDSNKIKGKNKVIQQNNSNFNILSDQKKEINVSRVSLRIQSKTVASKMINNHKIVTNQKMRLSPIKSTEIASKIINERFSSSSSNSSNNSNSSNSSNNSNSSLSQFKQTSKQIARHILSNDIATNTNEDVRKAKRIEARTMIDAITKQVQTLYPNETTFFIIQKTNEAIRKNLQKINATYRIEPIQTKHLNMAITIFLTGVVVVCGLIYPKMDTFTIKKRYLVLIAGFLMQPQALEFWKKKQYAEFEIECDSEIGRAFKDYLRSRVSSFSGYNVQEAKSVNRLKGKAEEQMQDYAVPAVPAGIEEGIEDDVAASISKLYNIPMGNKECMLLPELGLESHSIVVKLKRDASEKAVTDIVTLNNQIVESSLYLDTMVIKISLPRNFYSHGHLISYLTQVLQEYADNNQVFQASKILSHSALILKVTEPNSKKSSQVWYVPNDVEARLKEKDYYWPSDYISYQNSLQEMLKDMKHFVESQSFYLSRGIPFRRGYLVQGTPGCGKQHWILYLAAVLGREVCTLDMGHSQVKNMSDPGLAIAIQELGNNSILVLKNIDEIPMRDLGLRKAPTKRRGAPYGGGPLKPLTYSGILNVLDGVFAHTKGLIVIMTTNRKDVLDSEFMKSTTNALLRPGRCDMKVQIGLPTELQVTNLITSIFQKYGTTKEIQVAVHTFITNLKNHEMNYIKRKKKAEHILAMKNKKNQESIIGRTETTETTEATEATTTTNSSKLKATTIDILFNTARNSIPSVSKQEMQEMQEKDQNIDASPWQSFIGMKQIQNYCTQFTHSRDVDPLPRFLNKASIEKWLNEFHKANQNRIRSNINIRKLKKAVKEIETDGVGNADKLRNRERGIHNIKYRIDNALSIQTNICSLMECKEKNKDLYKKLSQYQKLLIKM